MTSIAFLRISCPLVSPSIPFHRDIPERFQDNFTFRPTALLQYWRREQEHQQSRSSPSSSPSPFLWPSSYPSSSNPPFPSYTPRHTWRRRNRHPAGRRRWRCGLSAVASPRLLETWFCWLVSRRAWKECGEVSRGRWWRELIVAMRVWVLMSPGWMWQGGAFVLNR